MKHLFLIMSALLAGMISTGQQNFTFLPAHPKPGEVITILYTPAGDIANTTQKVEASVYLYGSKGMKADDLPLTASGKTYTASVVTDTSVNFIQLGFYADKTYDNNFNDGYTIQLWGSDKLCNGSYASLASFYTSGCEYTGVEANLGKALAALEKERSLYPGNKKTTEWSYYSLLSKVKKDTLLTVIEKELEASVKAGLSKEEDYKRVEMLYNNAKLPSQSAFIGKLKKEKFPGGKWTIQEKIQQLYSETDNGKRVELAKSILANIDTNLSWKDFRNLKSSCQNIILEGYAADKQWDLLKKQETELSDKMSLASIYNDLAWKMQEKNEDLKKAEELSDWAIGTAKKEALVPSQPKPDYLTAKQWDANRQSTYALFADTYAMIEYKLGNYSKGYPFTEEAAIKINKGQDADLNNTWALLAEKTLPAGECKARLEVMAKDAKATDTVKAILKRVFLSENKSVEGFDEYMAGLDKEAKVKMATEIKKNMISENAPLFRLKTLQGEEVDLDKLKGKVVVLDFWATWCGPCKASLPSMQKEVNNFSNNAQVQFLFIDSWEKGDAAEKLKNSQDFITKNKYNFTVLMDNEDLVIGRYKVEGIPTKFVIDKNGMIRFRTVGFGGEEKLQKEIELMIGMCLNP